MRKAESLLEKLEVLGYGKINLTLDILGKREDGYHEVEMVMQSIALADSLTIEKKDSISISSNHQEVPIDKSNLVYKVAEALKKHTGYTGGAHFHIEKRIPVAAGLAGGSTNAASALKGLNRLWELGLAEKELREIGAKLGADIPFCLLGGTAIARGKGEKLTLLNDVPPLDLVLVKPPIGVSTKEVYGNFKCEEVIKNPATSKMKKAIKEGDIVGITENVGNVLEAVTLKMHPEIKKIKEKLLAAGARTALMSGSGPTVFAIVDNQQQGEEIVEKIKEDGLMAFVTKTVPFSCN